jgi:hypothetical protein
MQTLNASTISGVLQKKAFKIDDMNRMNEKPTRQCYS